jgi:hypothetical protein
MRVGRNDPCACGSGRKYKHCCARKQLKRERLQDSLGKGLFYLLGPVVIVVVAAMAISSARTRSESDEPPKVWSPSHNHWHYRLADGSEIEVRPGMVWSPQEKRFIQADPLTDAARKHVTSDLDQRLNDTEAGLRE